MKWYQDYERKNMLTKIIFKLDQNPIHSFISWKYIFLMYSNFNCNIFTIRNKMLTRKIIGNETTSKFCRKKLVRLFAHLFPENISIRMHSSFYCNGLIQAPTECLEEKKPVMKRHQNSEKRISFRKSIWKRAKIRLTDLFSENIFIRINPNFSFH